MKFTFWAMSLFLLSTTFSHASTDEHKNFAGIFVGATTFDGETELSYGLEYEYKFSPMWGAGLTLERTADSHHGGGADLAIAAIYLHPWKELRVGAGIGKEYVGSYTTDDHHEHGSYNETLTRLSLSYDFHVASIGIAPVVAVDFIDGETATVIGLAFVKSF